MSIRVKCEGCGRVLSVPDGCEGRAIQCATCGKRMRVPNQAPQTAADPARPAAAPAAPPPAAPVSGGTPEDKSAFFRALAEETAREQREAAAAKAAKTDAEAELAPLPEATVGGQSAAVRELRIKTADDESGYALAEGPVPPTPAAPPPAAPAQPPPAAPVSGGVPDKDALLRALAEEAAHEQRETDAAKAAKTDAEAELAPSPEATVRGQSAAVKELRIKTVAGKSGYVVAKGPVPPTPEPPPARYDTPRRPLRKLTAAAVGSLLLIVIIISVIVGLGSRKRPANEGPILNTQAVLPPVAMSPKLPTALKEAAQALADKAFVEVEVVEAAADAAAQPMPVLTPTGDLMLDITNLHIRDKSDADADIQEMRSASQSAVCESVAAKLREKGLTPVEAGQSAAAGKPKQPYSRLKVFISTTPVWAGFSFRERRTSPSAINDAPSQPGQPPRPQLSPHYSHRAQRRLPGAPSVPAWTPVKLWERLASGGLMISARFSSDAVQNWSAQAADDAQADLLPCGLRISIVRVVWEVGGRTHDLLGRPAEADTTLSGNDAETGAALPFRRPKRIREIHLTGRMGPGRTCLISGFCQYDDVDLYGNAAEAGRPATELLVAHEADWNTLWEGKANKDSISAACRNILRLDGGPAIVEALTAKPDRLSHLSTDALASVLREEHSRPEWARPFLAVRGPCGDAALICLARHAKEENERDFLQWVTAPADHSPESVRAACCALIDLGRPGPKVNALIDTGAVEAFSEVRSPRGSLAFPPQTAQTVLDWLVRNGTTSQRIGAAAAVLEGNIKKLQDPVRAFVRQSLGSDPETLYSLCKGIEKSRSPLAFEILSSVAQRQLMQADVGDRFLPPAAFSAAGGPLPKGRYSRTVAALVCAGLARFDRFEAGKALVGLIQSPGPVTRYCAIETLIALDDVDARKEIQPGSSSSPHGRAMRTRRRSGNCSIRSKTSSAGTTSL